MIQTATLIILVSRAKFVKKLLYKLHIYILEISKDISILFIEKF